MVLVVRSLCQRAFDVWASAFWGLCGWGPLQLASLCDAACVR